MTCPEAEAWEWIAGWINTPAEERDRSPFRVTGLCGTLSRLLDWGYLGTGLHWRMVARLRHMRESMSPKKVHLGCFWWPLTPEGDAERVRVCLRLAQEAREEARARG